MKDLIEQISNFMAHDESYFLLTRLEPFGEDYIFTFFISMVLILVALFLSRSTDGVLVHQMNIGINDKLKVKRHSKYITFTNVKPDYLIRSYWINNFENLGNIFNCKFIDVDIKKVFFSIRVNLYYDLLPDLVLFDDVPPLSPMLTWLGRNQFGKDVLVDLQSTPAIYVDGKPDAGKTVALLGLLEGFLRGIQGKTRVVVVTTKEHDFEAYYDRSDIDFKLFNPFDGDCVENIERIIAEFKNIEEIERDFSKLIKENKHIKSSDKKLERLRTLGIAEEFPRYFFIIDEAKDYLAKNKSDSKEIAQKKQELVSVVYTHIRRTARYLSMPIVVASQTQAESDLDIPLKSFHLRIASNTNEAMSRIIAGDKRLTDMSFRQGKFFVKTDSFEHIVKMPMIN